MSLISGPFCDDAIGIRFVIQFSHLANVGQTHKFGQFWPLLPSLGISAGTAADDQVRTFLVQSQRQSTSGGQRVGASQGAVSQQDSPVSAKGQALHQTFFDGRWPHR